MIRAAFLLVASLVGIMSAELHLLSGQSNMTYLLPAWQYTPHLDTPATVVKKAWIGAPIADWIDGPNLATLLDAGDAAMDGATPSRVVLVWMQGEADADAGSTTYAADLGELLAGVSAHWPGVPFAAVIGRISDHDDTAGWLAVRAAQEATGWPWVNTDDLNPMNGVHYFDNYSILGRRFAEAVNALGSE